MAGRPGAFSLARIAPTRPEAGFHRSAPARQEQKLCSIASLRLGSFPGHPGGPSGPALPLDLAPLPNRAKAFAFTLLELLAVVAVIGILAALLFPGLTAARVAANKARTRVQFSEWASALEGFRREYGYYPVLDSTGLLNPPGQATDPGQPHLFHDVLAARRRDGSALPATGGTIESLAAEAQNRKLISFHSFSGSEFTADHSPWPNLLCDACGNTEIAVLVDRNLDGVIQAGSDFATLPSVGGITPGWADFPAAGIRAGVIFYAPAPGATVQNPGFIFSWK
jgi:prepilin-type N-terminal cleavage/methylation domain-containing protein